MKKILRTLVLFALCAAVAGLGFVSPFTARPSAAFYGADASDPATPDPGATDPAVPDPGATEPAPEYLSRGDGTHTVRLSGGTETTEPCAFTCETFPHTQTECGRTVYTCEKCGYSYAADETPAERDRKESRPMGDVDGTGDLEPADARLLLRWALSLECPGSGLEPYGDLTGNGEIDPGDARLALRLSLGLGDPAARHEYEIISCTAPGCTAAGQVGFRCAYCGEEGLLKTPAAGHGYVLSNETPASCTERGSQLYVCAACGAQSTKTLAPKGHDWVRQADRAATCTADGEKRWACSRCPEQKSEVIPKTGHDWVRQADRAATCTANGEKRWKCSRCPEQKSEAIPKTGHTWTDAGANVKCGACGTGAEGFAKAGGKTFYCVKGVKQKSWCKIGNDRYFFDRATGAMAAGATVDGIRLTADGKAEKTQYNLDKADTFIKAKNIVAEITLPGDSVSDKKYKAFRWVMQWPYAQYRGVGQAMQTPGFEMLFANDIFDKHNGCCGSDSYAFAFLAVECGCKAVYVCDDGVSSGGHAWVTMEGNNRVYDVIFAKAKGFSANYDASVSDYRKYQPRMTYVGG